MDLNIENGKNSITDYIIVYILQKLSTLVTVNCIIGHYVKNRSLMGRNYFIEFTQVKNECPVLMQSINDLCIYLQLL